MLDFAVDLCYLATMNEPALNKRFNQYGVLIRYWQRGRLSSPQAKSLATRIESDYREYVQAHWSDLMNGEIKAVTQLTFGDDSVTRRIERLNSEFPNLLREYPDPASLIAMSSIVKAVPISPDDESFWKYCDNEIKRRFRRGWSGLTTAEKLDKIQQKAPKPLQKPDSLLRQLAVDYSFYSNYVHATPYAVSQDAADDNSLDGDCVSTDEDLCEIEWALFIYMHVAVERIASLFVSLNKEDLWGWYANEIGHCPNIKRKFLRIMRGNL